jgi:hypothetical protein
VIAGGCGEFDGYNNSTVKSLARNLSELKNNASGFSEAFKAMNESIHIWAERNKSAFEQTAKLLSQAAIKFKETEKVAVPILHKYKWFITPNMSIDIIHIIAKLDKNKGNHSQAVNKLFVDYFLQNNCQNIESMVLSWKTIPYLIGE